MKRGIDRFLSLFVKLWSVKTIPAVIFSYGFLQTLDTAIGFFCLLSWALVISFRYAEKVKGLVK